MARSGVGKGMDETHYKKGLLALLADGVYSEALFHSAALTFAGQREKAKCRLLERLEACGVAQMRGLAGKYELACDEKGIKTKARKRGQLLVTRRWDAVMRQFSGEMAREIGGIRKLYKAAPEADRYALEYMTAHERLLGDFIAQELAGDSEAARAEIEQFLQ